nr:hypothetical protein P5640_18355 [Bacillus subtilis]
MERPSLTVSASESVEPVNGMKVVDYVLGSFTKEEAPEIEEAVDKSVKACEASLSKPFLEVMNEFNAKV